MRTTISMLSVAALVLSGVLITDFRSAWAQTPSCDFTTGGGFVLNDDGSRDKTHEVALQRKFDGLAKDVGELVFRQRQGESGLDAEVDRLISEMRGVRSELDAET